MMDDPAASAARAQDLCRVSEILCLALWLAQDDEETRI